MNQKQSGSVGSPSDQQGSSPEGDLDRGQTALQNGTREARVRRAGIYDRPGPSKVRGPRERRILVYLAVLSAVLLTLMLVLQSVRHS